MVSSVNPEMWREQRLVMSMWALVLIVLCARKSSAADDTVLFEAEVEDSLPRFKLRVRDVAAPAKKAQAWCRRHGLDPVKCTEQIMLQIAPVLAAGASSDT